MIDSFKQELIALEVVKVLKSRFDSFPEDLTGERNSPFHKAFLEAFADKLKGKVESIPSFISLSSWAHGLSTTIGQNFFERTAQILCDGEKKEFTTRRKTTLEITSDQRIKIAILVNELSNGRRKPNLNEENLLIFGEAETDDWVDATDFTADVFFEDDIQVVCLELKTVRPNKGVFKVEKEKILQAKAALKNKFPDKEIRFFFGFPFDPTSPTPTGYDKDRFMNNSVDFRKYLAQDDFLLAAELWNYLSGERETMETILKIINSIATVKFLEEFAFLLDKQNLRDKPENYIGILIRWHMEREAQLAASDTQIAIAIQNNRNLLRIYNQNIFNDKANYNENRLSALKNLVNYNNNQLVLD